MKKRDEIRRILVEEFGFRDLDAYKKWIDEQRPKLVVDQKLIERLSPDEVDCRDFWSVCDELFALDPVCNLAVRPSVGKLPFSVETRMDANRLNLRFAKSFGITDLLQENAHERLKMLEIGPGYGSLMNFVETHTNFQYTGVDAVPRVSGVIQTTAEGLIPDELLQSQADSYSYVVSSNVFQHFSAKQRERYYEHARRLLVRGGLFIFNLCVDTGKATYLRDAAGNAWCDHYGQFTAIPKANIYAELGAIFGVLYVTQRYDSVFNFVCQKRD
ncbi:MAG TPA: class I SAM-dependent methyltransferase [Polyangiaceae bacterium]|jgi:SAM-dependent methyltransferase|nr:class I SAM-dependent methyltransferase [Polyangiaceae bacterium]